VPEPKLKFKLVTAIDNKGAKTTTNVLSVFDTTLYQKKIKTWIKSTDALDST